MKECNYQFDLSTERMSDGIETAYFCNKCFEEGVKDDSRVFGYHDYEDKTQDVECQSCGTTYLDELSLQEEG